MDFVSSSLPRPAEINTPLLASSGNSSRLGGLSRGIQKAIDSSLIFKTLSCAFGALDMKRRIGVATCLGREEASGLYRSEAGDLQFIYFGPCLPIPPG